MKRKSRLAGLIGLNGILLLSGCAGSSHAYYSTEAEQIDPFYESIEGEWGDMYLSVSGREGKAVVDMVITSDIIIYSYYANEDDKGYYDLRNGDVLTIEARVCDEYAGAYELVRSEYDYVITGLE